MHFLFHWLFVNVPFTEEDKILIDYLLNLKGYNGIGKHLVKECLIKGWNLPVVAKATGY